MHIHSDLHSCLVLTLLGGVELLELHFDYFTGILSLVDNQYNMVLFIKNKCGKEHFVTYNLSYMMLHNNIFM